MTLDDALGFQLTEVWDVSFTEASGALCATSRITVAVRPAEPA